LFDDRPGIEPLGGDLTIVVWGTNSADDDGGECAADRGGAGLGGGPGTVRGILRRHGGPLKEGDAFYTLMVSGGPVAITNDDFKRARHALLFARGEVA
jgi:hypothetical protein